MPKSTAITEVYASGLHGLYNMEADLTVKETALPKAEATSRILFYGERG